MIDLEMDMRNEHFGIDFEYEATIELCGTVHELDGHVYLSCHWNGSWELDDVFGKLVEDPEGEAKVFDLVNNPQTRKAIKKWLLDNKDFVETADDRVRWHD